MNNAGTADDPHQGEILMNSACRGPAQYHFRRPGLPVTGISHQFVHIFDAGVLSRHFRVRVEYRQRSVTGSGEFLVHRFSKEFDLATWREEPFAFVAGIECYGCFIPGSVIEV
jgi:hypothetical protein